jgi:hypothetical protein
MQRWLAIPLGLAGLLALSFTYRQQWNLIVKGLNDFPAFYCAPRLLATHDLYNPAMMAVEQARVLGVMNPNIEFIRLPFVAVAFWPLSELPYRAAYALWQLGCVAAMGAFIFWWPADRLKTFLLCCWFPPVAASFANAQDVPFLLVWGAMAAALVSRNHPVAAGLVLSLCAAKFHLLVFLPVVIVGGRLWKLGMGWLTGTAVLLGVSFAVSGWNWPLEFYRALVNPAVHPGLSGTSLLFQFQRLGAAFWILAPSLIVAVGVVVWIYARRGDFPLALGLALLGGTLAGFHVYLQDYLLWLPALALGVTRLSPKDSKSG